MNIEKKDWVLENRYRKLIMEILSKEAKTKKEIQEEFKITLLPYISKYKPKATISISSQALKNHLGLLLREGMIKKEGKQYIVNEVKKIPDEC